MTSKLAAFSRTLLDYLKEGWLALAEAHSLYENEHGGRPTSPVTDGPAKEDKEQKSKIWRRMTAPRDVG